MVSSDLTPRVSIGSGSLDLLMLVTLYEDGVTHFLPRFAFYHHFCFEYSFYLVMKDETQVVVIPAAVDVIRAAIFGGMFSSLLGEDIKFVATTFSSSETNPM